MSAREDRPGALQRTRRVRWSGLKSARRGVETPFTNLAEVELERGRCLYDVGFRIHALRCAAALAMRIPGRGVFVGVVELRV